MSKAILSRNLSDSDLQEWLEYSNKLLSAVDEIIEVTPINEFPSTRQEILRFLFMDARTASYDICVLAESLLNNDSHHFSRAIGYSIRLLLEHTIDYFYISESDDSVAERYMDFLYITNSTGEYRKNKEKAFEQKYGKLGGDYWSGKSRETKTIEGFMKQTRVRNASAHAGRVKPIFQWLNEHVHGNSVVRMYWSFDKYGEHEHEYRDHVASGLLNFWYFYLLSDAYCKFTGRGSEVSRFGFYDPYMRNLFNNKIDVPPEH